MLKFYQIYNIVKYWHITKKFISVLASNKIVMDKEVKTVVQKGLKFEEKCGMFTLKLVPMLQKLGNIS